MLWENNTRRGFFEQEQFQAALAHLPDYLRAVFEAAFVVGWRVPSEILTRQWAHLDLKAGVLRLEPGETKNGQGRTFKFKAGSRLHKVLQKQRDDTRAFERAHARIVPWVFHHSGSPIRDFRGAWRQACKNAGCPGRVPHDFRRTAVQNLERAGVRRSTAMALVGHKTETIYRRYAIAAR